MGLAYRTFLKRLDLKHVDYIFDTAHFGNELDSYTSPQWHVDFTIDRGERFVRFAAVSHPTTSSRFVTS